MIGQSTPGNLVCSQALRTARLILYVIVVVMFIFRLAPINEVMCVVIEGCVIIGMPEGHGKERRMVGHILNPS